jgi:hypothetical protein
MKTIKQLMSDYLRERREMLTSERMLFGAIVIAVAIVATVTFVALGVDLGTVNPIYLLGAGVLGYLAWIVFFRRK